MRFSFRVALITMSLMAPFAQASDISLVSGLYQKAASKANGTQGIDIDSSTIEAGGRFGTMVDGKLGWFAQALLALRSYDAPGGVKTPSNSTSLRAGGGVRVIGKRWNESAIPFIWGLGEFRSEKYGNVANGIYDGSETETSGLFYSGGIGLRLSIDSTFFVDLEGGLFESALFANTKTTLADANNSTREQSRTEIYFKTYSPLANVVVSLGIKL